MTEIYIDEEIQALRKIHNVVLKAALDDITIKEILACQAQNILDAHKSGNEAVTFHLACWSPQFIGQSTDEIMNSPLTLDQAKQTIAQEYGYSDWTKVEALCSSKLDINFEKAVDSVVTGEVEVLSELVSAKPQLTGQTSQYPHSATLLHYVSANGVESHRQMIPLNAVDVVNYLIAAGSDVNATANMYGGGSTPLALLMSSAHPANAGLVDELSDVFTSAGAI